MSDDVDVLDARIKVIQAIHRLRYSGALMTVVPSASPDDTEVEFLDRLIRFFTEFNTVLTNVSDTTTNMAAELQELRSQRKAVRDFLGLPPSLGDSQ